MSDPKKVSAKRAAKPSAAAKSAAPKSAAAQAKIKEKAAKPDLRAAPSTSKEAEIIKAAVAPAAAKAAAAVAPKSPVKVAEPGSPVLSVSRPSEPQVVPVAPMGDRASPPVSVEAVANSLAPKAAALRQAVGESVKASATGALAVNDKVIEALQTQSHAALDLWRTTVATPHLSDVFRLQANGARQAYETASAQWKDIAETTAHWFNKTVEPLSSAISDLKR